MSSNIQKRNSSSSSSSGKPRIRKCRTRSDNPLSGISFAEARRQVYQALLIHRSRSSFSSASASASSSSSSHDVVYAASAQVVQSMPTSTEPIWSTTAPSLLPHVPYCGATMEVPVDIEFEWGENQASSYSWWLAFLDSLDGNKHTAKNIHEEYSKYPMAALGSSMRYFGQRHGGNLKVEEADEQSSSPDEWLTFPSADDHEGEFNNVIP